MALTENTVEDRIEVVGDFKIVQIRSARIIYDDGNEISRSYSRRLLEPCIKIGDPGVWHDTDISGESSEVQGICGLVWTDSVKTAFKNHFDSKEEQDV